MHTPSNILIARLSSIGDIILTTPLVRSVRQAFPDARITYLVKKEFAPLVQFNPHIDQVIVFDKTGGIQALNQLRERIRMEKFDWFIDLHNNLRTNFLKFFLRFPEVSSYSKETFRRILLVHFGKNVLAEAKPIYLKYFDALQHRNIRYDSKGTQVLFPESERENIRNKLINDNIVPGLALVIICPGASYSNKQWLPERFAGVADHLVEQNNSQVVYLGGPNDSTLCRNIISIMKQRAINYAGQLSLLGSAALLAEATLVITNDSGMMHLAQSQNAPVVAIFGPTTKELGFFPVETKSRVVEKEVSCRPCTSKGLNYCPKKHFNCMRLIGTTDLLNAADELMSS